MPDFAVSYLLKETHPDLHAQFKATAMSWGFSDRTIGMSALQNWHFFVLPHTTIWGTFLDLSSANIYFSQIRSALPHITIERYIICPRDNYIVESNRYYPGPMPANEIQQCIAHQRAHP